MITKPPGDIFWHRRQAGLFAISPFGRMPLQSLIRLRTMKNFEDGFGDLNIISIFV